MGLWRDRASFAAFVAGGGTGWLAHGAAVKALDLPELSVDGAGRASALCRRSGHPGRSPGNERVHLQHG